MPEFNQKAYMEQIMKPLSINQIFSASSEIMENAQDLIEEAELLLKNNKYARAFALAHLASEELVKFNVTIQEY